MFTAEETTYRLQLQMASAKDSFIRDLLAAVQHFLEPFDRLLQDDVRQRVQAALGGAAA